MTLHIIALIPGIAIAIGLLTAFATRVLPLKFGQKLVSYILVICFGATLGHAVYAAIATRTNLKRAEVARLAKQPAVVIREATAALRVDPNSAEAYVKRATGYAVAGDCSHALIDIENALAISSGIADAYVVRANCSAKSGDIAAAIADFTRAIDRDSRSFVSYAGRAQALWLIGDQDGAIRDINQAIRLSPDTPVVYLLRAQIISANDKKSALYDFDRVLSMQAPDELRALALIGQAGTLEQIPGKESAALRSADEAVRLAPGLSITYVERGNAYKALGMYPNALDDYAKAIGIDPSSTIAYVNRSIVLALTGNSTSALEDLNRAIQLGPDLIQAYTLRAEIFTRLGQKENALADLRTVNRLAQSHRRFLSAGTENMWLPLV